MRTISFLNFWIRALLVAAWFCLSCMICMCAFLVRWKDPSMGAVFGRLFHFGATRILGYRVKIEKQARLYTHQPCIYVVNHQSNLDVVTMGSVYPYRTVVIGKKELMYIPFFNLFFIGSGNILIDRKNRKSAVGGIQKAHEEMKKKALSLWLFPEGTRNKGTEVLLPFKKGAFHLAILGGYPIVPIVHANLNRYYQHENRRIIPGEILVKVLEPIETKGLTLDDVPALLDRVRNLMNATLQESEMKKRGTETRIS